MEANSAVIRIRKSSVKSDIMEQAIERWNVNELLNREALNIMGWYLSQKISKGVLKLALNYHCESRDIIQTACWWLLKNPPPKSLKRTSAVCIAVRWTVQGLIQNGNLHRKPTERLHRHFNTDDNEILDRHVNCPVDENLLRDEMLAKTKDVFRCLDQRSREILLARFGIDREFPATLEELGAKWGITRERVRQIEAKAFASVKASPIPKSLYDSHGELAIHFHEPDIVNRKPYSTIKARKRLGQSVTRVIKKHPGLTESQIVKRMAAHSSPRDVAKWLRDRVKAGVIRKNQKGQFFYIAPLLRKSKVSISESDIGSVQNSDSSEVSVAGIFTS